MKNLLIGLCCVMCTICQYTYADNIQNTKQVLEVKLETGQVLELTANDQVLTEICRRVTSGYSGFSEWVKAANPAPPVGPALGGTVKIGNSMYGMDTQEAYEYLIETCIVGCKSCDPYPACCWIHQDGV